MAKPVYLNQIKAAQELGITQQAVATKLAHKLVIGARKVGGRWFIPSPVRLRPAVRGPQSRHALALLRQDKEAERAIAAAFENAKLYIAPVSELAACIPAATVDIILTDPPYAREFLSTYSDLAKFAAHALKPGGSLLVMVGQSYLPEVMARLNSGLRYHWVVAYLTPGGQAARLWDRSVNTFWKPVLWYVKGIYKGNWIGDLAKSNVNDNDKQFHRWGQSESGIADLLDRFTKPGDVVCDPFVGGGTVAVVALRTGRQFTGGDADATAISTTKRRVAASCS